MRGGIAEIVVVVPVVYEHQLGHIPPQLANFPIKSVNIGSCFTMNQQKPQLARIGQKHYCARFALTDQNKVGMLIAEI